MIETNDIPNHALVMVAVLPSPKDLEIARVFGWYRIPMRMAPKIVDVDSIVFYQPGSFPQGHGSMIEWFAEVHGHELTTRSELIRNEPNHPHAQEEYFKIQLGSLSRLTRPITADKWKRITFFYSLGYLVNRATIINDLVVKSDDRELLWKTLRERNNKPYLNETKASTPIPDESLILLVQQIITWNAELGLKGNNILE